MTNLRLVTATVALFLMLTGLAFAQSAKLDQSQIEIPTTIPAAAQASDHFDVDAATEAYLAEMPASARSRSDAYFEGGYWLQLWDFLYGAVVCLILLNWRWSAAMRNVAERITRFRWLQTFLYWVEFLLVTTILSAPIEIYEGYIREHQYGLANQTFGPWMAAGQISAGEHDHGWHRGRGAVRHRAQTAANLVAVGSHRQHRPHRDFHHDRSGLSLPHLQQDHAAG